VEDHESGLDLLQARLQTMLGVSGFLPPVEAVGIKPGVFKVSTLLQQTIFIKHKLILYPCLQV